MLYLAEVQKRTRVLGSGKTEFKLLACQRSEYSWTVASEDVIPAPDDVPYNSGALVLVDLNSNRQIQRHFEAGRQLVGILQNFSRRQEKSKTQEEEIEQWKQSLTYQSQELNRREMEMESRQIELEQMEEDFEQLEQQRQEIEAAREQVNQLQAEFERKSQELEGAWAQLNGEMRRFDERRDSQVSDPAQLQALHQSVERLSNLGNLSDVAPELLPEALTEYLEAVEQQQQQLGQHWQTFQQERDNLNAQHSALEDRTQQLQARWQAWHDADAALRQELSDVKAQQTSLSVKQDMLQLVSDAAQQQSDLQQQLSGMPGTLLSLEDKIDLSALEEMPLEDLRAKVAELEEDFKKSSQFVSSQEEELSLQQQAIDELNEKLAEANDYDRLQLETQLADEKESYRMLDHTLVGQRRNLQERELLLKRHQGILAQREGQPVDEESGLENNVILTQATAIYSALSQRAQMLQRDIEAIEAKLQEHEASVNDRSASLEEELKQLKQDDNTLQGDRAAVAETQGRVQLYEEILQPVQDAFDNLRNQLPALAAAAERLQAAEQEQAEVIAEMRNIIIQTDDDPSHQLAAS